MQNISFPTEVAELATRLISPFSRSSRAHREESTSGNACEEAGENFSRERHPRTLAE
jgi:hypothetical protein